MVVSPFRFFRVPETGSVGSLAETTPQHTNSFKQIRPRDATTKHHNTPPSPPLPSPPLPTPPHPPIPPPQPRLKLKALGTEGLPHQAQASSQPTHLHLAGRESVGKRDRERRRRRGRNETPGLGVASAWPGNAFRIQGESGSVFVARLPLLRWFQSERNCRTPRKKRNLKPGTEIGDGPDICDLMCLGNKTQQFEWRLWGTSKTVVR